MSILSPDQHAAAHHPSTRAIAADPTFQRILVPIDGGPLSVEAVSHALALARKTDARICFLTVTEPFEPAASYAVAVSRTFEAHQRNARLHAEHVLTPAMAAASASDVPAEELHLEDADPYRAIIRAAEDFGCDLIVMASHGRRGVSAVLLGSQTVKVLTHSTIPVLVCRAQKSPARQN